MMKKILDFLLKHPEAELAVHAAIVGGFVILAILIIGWLS